MFKIEGKNFILENGSFKVNIFKNLDLPEKDKNFINESLKQSVVPDDFKLKYYFEGDMCVDIAKQSLKFCAHGGDALDVNVDIKINDDDIRSILTYIITEYEDESDNENENDNEDNLLNCESIVKSKEDDKFSTL